MKKFFFFAILAAAFTFAACGNESTDGQEGQDSVVVVADTLPQVDTVAVDTVPVEAPAPAQKVAQPAKKAEAAPAETHKKVDPSTLKKSSEIPNAKVLDPNQNSNTGLKRNPNAPASDNGNTLQNNGTSAQPVNNQVGSKKKHL